MRAVLWFFLYPGNLICDIFNVPSDSDHRAVLRMFINTIVWSTVGIAATLWVML